LAAERRRALKVTRSAPGLCRRRAAGMDRRLPARRGLDFHELDRIGCEAVS
jgi:hypothetical protein